MPWPRGLKYIEAAIVRPKDKVCKTFKRRKNVMSVKYRDNPLGRCPRLMRFSRNRKINKGRRERANHRREGTDQSNAIVVSDIIL